MIARCQRIVRTVDLAELTQTSRMLATTTGQVRRLTNQLLLSLTQLLVAVFKLAGEMGQAIKQRLDTGYIARRRGDLAEQYGQGIESLQHVLRRRLNKRTRLPRLRRRFLNVKGDGRCVVFNDRQLGGGSFRCYGSFAGFPLHSSAFPFDSWLGSRVCRLGSSRLVGNRFLRRG